MNPNGYGLPHSQCHSMKKSGNVRINESCVSSQKNKIPKIHGKN